MIIMMSYEDDDDENNDDDDEIFCPRDMVKSRNFSIAKFWCCLGLY